MAYEPQYQVGRTIRVTHEYPKGIPCIVYDGDSVLCMFEGTHGMERAKAVCFLLNKAYNSQDMGAWAFLKVHHCL
jgi:hypothetical protein